jgi:hypothetical protein
MDFGRLSVLDSRRFGGLRSLSRYYGGGEGRESLGDRANEMLIRWFFASYHGIQAVENQLKKNNNLFYSKIICHTD